MVSLSETMEPVGPERWMDSVDKPVSGYHMSPPVLGFRGRSQYQKWLNQSINPVKSLWWPPQMASKASSYHVTSSLGLLEEELQTIHPVSITLASFIRCPQSGHLSWYSLQKNILHSWYEVGMYQINFVHYMDLSYNPYGLDPHESSLDRGLNMTFLKWLMQQSQLSHSIRFW